MERSRRHLYVRITSGPAPVGLPIRCVRRGDEEDLSSLMFSAYRGSVDDDGESLSDAEQSVHSTLNGEHGDFLDDCSFVALDAAYPVAVTLVTMLHGQPLLAQVYTDPTWKRRGLARALIKLSMNALAARSETELSLVVTSGNDPAERLYESLGFVNRYSGD